MEIFKKILDLITSFFTNSTQKKKEEIALADQTEVATVEKIRANSNAQVIVQQEKTQQALDEIRQKHEQEKKKPDNFDEQFGKDW